MAKSEGLFVTVPQLLCLAAPHKIWETQKAPLFQAKGGKSCQFYTGIQIELIFIFNHFMYLHRQIDSEQHT